jgi:hypothetical protein
MPVMRYVPYPDLDGAPNLIVDGAATGGTTITLSHWPHAVCPPGLEADLSAQMAFAFLDRGDIGPDLVSNNHFDQDGLVGVFAMVDPEAAHERRGLLIDVAGAGDFATYRSRDAARISMAIGAYADPAVSPLDLGDGDYPSRVAIFYRELLGRLPELCDKTERFRELWAPDDAVLEASEAAIASGRVTIEEIGSRPGGVHHPRGRPDRRRVPLRLGTGLGPPSHGPLQRHRVLHPAHHPGA